MSDYKRLDPTIRFAQQSINQFIIDLIRPITLPQKLSLVNLLPMLLHLTRPRNTHTSHQTCHQSTCWWENVDKLRDFPITTKHRQKVTFFHERASTGMTQFITLNWWMFIVLDCSIQFRVLNMRGGKSSEFRWLLGRNSSANLFFNHCLLPQMVKTSSYFVLYYMFNRYRAIAFYRAWHGNVEHIHNVH